MFGTFTGNSRRPRNVNLSGQTGNPFANTSWSPSVASNATKTVSDAQAEREKRQAERQRLKAAGRIQRTWRGHRTRTSLAESRRASFDQIYASEGSFSSPQRLQIAFSYLLSFFKRSRDDDIQRLLIFIHGAERNTSSNLVPIDAHDARMRRFTKVLVEALERMTQDEYVALLDGDKIGDIDEYRASWQDMPCMLRLIDRIQCAVAGAIRDSTKPYFTSLASISHSQSSPEWISIISHSLTVSLQTVQENTNIYHSFALYYLTKERITLFEENMAEFAPLIEIKRLSEAIVEVYASGSARNVPTDGLLWLLAHSIALSQGASSRSHDFLYLSAIHTQVTRLSSEISLRVEYQPTPEPDDNAEEQTILQPLDPYVKHHLTSLVDQDGIQNLLRDFSNTLAASSNQEFQGTSLLAGFILSLLQSFPGHADDTRMRLFLGQIPAQAGKVPTVKFLWQIMRQTSVFRKLRTESEKPVNVLRNYLLGSNATAAASLEEQEWPVVLLFLELYIFILRLSDDEDFFSGIYPEVISDNTSTSRIRACSLALQDVESLTIFLKNTAFALHYRARDISSARLDTKASSNQQPGSTVGLGAGSVAPRKLDLDSLRSIITTALKMLYERDSRKRFLPVDHWLMTDKLDKDAFISAVVAEEQHQIQEEADDSDDDEAMDGLDPDEPSFYSTAAGQRVSRHARMERLRSQQLRAQKERRLAEMGPKLEILKHMPFVVPFETRVMLFRQFIRLDRDRRGGDVQWQLGVPWAKHQARISRGSLFEDAYQQFYGIGDGLKDPISITFVDQFDTPEPGIDGGGVTKEFLTSVTSEAFGEPDKTGFTMFTSSDQGLLYPDPTMIDVLREYMRSQGLDESSTEWRDEISRRLRRFEFLGRIMGKCMYDGILVDLVFAGFFLLKWSSIGVQGESSYKGSVNDLRDMDEELYKGMLRLKNYTDDVSDLGFDFTINDQISAPGESRVKTVTRNLVPNGEDVAVTNDNRLLYISYVARHRLVVQPYLQTAAFLRGLHSIIRPTWLSMFNQSELQRLVGGDSSEIDIADLRNHTVYSGLYQIGDDGKEHPTIKIFWKVMTEFTDAQRRDVLKYVTSTPRAPLLGFSQLKPLFSIRDGGTDATRLPSASTCVNLLKLPRYLDEKTLKEKLLYAVTSGAGFGLS